MPNWTTRLLFDVGPPHPRRGPPPSGQPHAKTPGSCDALLYTGISLKSRTNERSASHQLQYSSSSRLTAGAT
jgi:hypothetical protein